MKYPAWLVRTAQRRGMTEQEYLAKIAAKQRWCIGCKGWHHESSFGPDRSRPDGLNRRCYASARRQWEQVLAKRKAGKLPAAKVLAEVLVMLDALRPHQEIASFIETVSVRDVEAPTP